jgi:hypothetical protein
MLYRKRRKAFGWLAILASGLFACSLYVLSEVVFLAPEVIQQALPDYFEPEAYGLRREQVSYAVTMISRPVMLPGPGDPKGLAWIQAHDPQGNHVEGVMFVAFIRHENRVYLSGFISEQELQQDPSIFNDLFSDSEASTMRTLMAD